MRLTDEFITKTKRFKKQPEPHDPKWTTLNEESPEMEVCEFLYSLVRLLKPSHVLETGGGTGNSGAYMAQALKENKKGLLICLEPFPQSYRIAGKLWIDLGVKDYIHHHPLTSHDFNPGGARYQILFLDSEPSCRFTEVKKFYPNLDPGGLIIIHDLRWKWGGEWEDYRPLFGDLLKDFSLQVITLDSPRGLTILQKVKPIACYYQLLKGEHGV